MYEVVAYRPFSIMDPLSITTSATALATLTLSLIKNITDCYAQTQEVDNVVEELDADLRNVQRVIRSIADEARTASESENEAGSNELWFGVDEALADCRSMLDSISAELITVGLRSSNGFADRVLKTHRLDTRTEEIRRLRDRVRWNQSILQMVLEMIIM